MSGQLSDVTRNSGLALIGLLSEFCLAEGRMPVLYAIRPGTAAAETNTAITRSRALKHTLTSRCPSGRLASRSTLLAGVTHVFPFGPRAEHPGDACVWCGRTARETNLPPAPVLPRASGGARAARPYSVSARPRARRSSSTAAATTTSATTTMTMISVVLPDDAVVAAVAVLGSTKRYVSMLL